MALLFRLSEMLSLKQDFRSIYVRPLRELLDGLLKHEPDFAEKLILKISDLSFGKTCWKPIAKQIYPNSIRAKARSPSYATSGPHPNWRHD